MNIVYFIALMGTVACSYAMEEGNLVKTSKQEIEAHKYPIMYLNNNCTVYIGTGDVRDKIHDIFGQQFPLNTVFFQVGFKKKYRLVQPSKTFKNPEEKTAARRKALSLVKFPEFVPYELIKNIKEGELLKLKSHNQEYMVICQQKGGDHCGTEMFDELLQMRYRRFLQYPNHLVNGEESLLAAKVIVQTPGFSWTKNTRHGENATPDAL